MHNIETNLPSRPTHCVNKRSTNRNLNNNAAGEKAVYRGAALWIISVVGSANAAAVAIRFHRCAYISCVCVCMLCVLCFAVCVLHVCNFCTERARNLEVHPNSNTIHHNIQRNYGNLLSKCKVISRSNRSAIKSCLQCWSRIECVHNSMCNLVVFVFLRRKITRSRSCRLLVQWSTNCATFIFCISIQR